MHHEHFTLNSVLGGRVSVGAFVLLVVVDGVVRWKKPFQSSYRPQYSFLLRLNMMIKHLDGAETTEQQ